MTFITSGYFTSFIGSDWESIGLIVYDVGERIDRVCADGSNGELSYKSNVIDDALSLNTPPPHYYCLFEVDDCDNGYYIDYFRYWCH